MNTESKWYVLKNRIHEGPFESEQIRQHCTMGRFKVDDYAISQKSYDSGDIRYTTILKLMPDLKPVSEKKPEQKTEQKSESKTEASSAPTAEPKSVTSTKVSIAEFLGTAPGGLSPQLSSTATNAKPASANPLRKDIPILEIQAIKTDADGNPEPAVDVGTSAQPSMQNFHQDVFQEKPFWATPKVAALSLSVVAAVGGLWFWNSSNNTQTQRDPAGSVKLNDGVSSDSQGARRIIKRTNSSSDQKSSSGSSEARVHSRRPNSSAAPIVMSITPPAQPPAPSSFQNELSPPPTSVEERSAEQPALDTGRGPQPASYDEDIESALPSPAQPGDPGSLNLRQKPNQDQDVSDDGVEGQL